MAGKRRVNKRLLTKVAVTAVEGALLLALMGKPVRAQIPLIRIVGQCFPLQSQPDMATRIVMHGVGFLPHSDRLDRGSVAVLDDAATLVKRHPKATVYNIVPAMENRTGNAAAASLASQRTRVVEMYLTRRGVPPRHLVTAASDPPPSRYASVTTLADQRTLAWLELPIASQPAMLVDPYIR